mmetsp:Transcript_27096/g.50558  ORF Transcript_27096/g.50558 Transcript_27096/m.50558 type:complete len:128 (-) Transcript_27096:17-400(-)
MNVVQAEARQHSYVELTLVKADAGPTNRSLFGLQDMWGPDSIHRTPPHSSAMSLSTSTMTLARRCLRCPSDPTGSSESAHLAMSQNSLPTSASSTPSSRNKVLIRADHGPLSLPIFPMQHGDTANGT